MTEFTPEQEESVVEMARDWAFDKTVRRACEELAELSLELLHYHRGRSSIPRVRSELADVRICLRHLEYTFGSYQKELDEKVEKGVQHHRSKAIGLTRSVLK